MKVSNYIIISILLIIILALTGCSLTEQQEVKSSVQNAIDSPEVQSIRNMTTNEGIKLGDLFDAGMGSPSYELYNPAEDGNTYVTIKGNMIYKKAPVVVAIQYKKISETEYEFYTLTTNDIPVDEIEQSQFFDYFKSEYEKKEQTANTANATSSNEDDFSQTEGNSSASSDSNTITQVQPQDLEDSELYSTIIEKKELFNILLMSKVEMIDRYGVNYEIQASGAEGLEQSYYYKNLGINIKYDDNGIVSYIICDKKVNIYGVSSGMNFKQIQDKLGKAKINENWIETPENKMYDLTYDIGGHRFVFTAFDNEGTDTVLTISNLELNVPR